MTLICKSVMLGIPRYLLHKCQEQSWKRMASISAGKCCGVREDCALRPCKDEAECSRISNVDYRKDCANKIDVRVFHPRCCEDCSLLPHFDWLYYKPSDKRFRAYQKTWKDCPPVYKNRCCYKNIPPYPPYKRRNVKSETCREPTACEKNKGVFNAVCGTTKESNKCPDIKTNCLRVGRRPPTCERPRKIKHCVKLCCPYPAFSECCSSGRAKILNRSKECRCFGISETCIFKE